MKRALPYIAIAVLVLLGAYGCARYADQPKRENPRDLDSLVTETRDLTDHVTVHPDDVDAVFELANVLAQRGLFPEAIGRYREVLAADEAHAAAWHNLGLCYERQDLLRDAHAAYDTALAIDPSNELFQRDEARIEVLMKGNLIGRRAYADLLSRCYQALAQREAEGDTEAAAHAESLLAQYPEQSEAWNVAGLVAARTHDLTLAAERFDRAIELDPASYQPRYNRAILAWEEGDRAIARGQLQALRNLVKNDAAAKRYLDTLLADLEAGRSPADSAVVAKTPETY